MYAHMASDQEPNTRISSTTWGYRRVKLLSPARASGGSVPQARLWRQLSRWDPRKVITITVSYRGGAEAWYEVHARGSVGRFPGGTALHDVMRSIYNDK